MTTTRPRVKVSFTPDEKVQVEALAGQLKLSVSELLRRLVLGHRLPSAEDFAAAEGIRNLLRINADQARLGNLLLFALDVGDGALSPHEVAKINRLAESIQATQTLLKDAVKTLHHQIHPRTK